MNKNLRLSTWLDLGVGRGVALAKVLNCSRQYIGRMKEVGMSESQWDAFRFGMSIVELDERRSVKKIETNILKAAKASHSKNLQVRCFAECELDKWVEALRITA